MLTHQRDPFVTTPGSTLDNQTCRSWLNLKQIRGRQIRRYCRYSRLGLSPGNVLQEPRAW